MGRCRPVFSDDSKLVFCCVGSIVKVLSVATQEVVRTLDGHAGPVTSVALNPNNRLQMFTGAEDGYICLWDYYDGVLLKKFNFEAPVLNLLQHPAHKTTLFVLSSTFQALKQREGLLEEVHSKNSSVEKAKKELRKQVPLRLFSWGFTSATRKVMLCRPKSCTGLDISPDGDILMWAAKRKVCFLRISKPDEVKKLRHKNKITAFAAHPVEKCVGIGDRSGCIKFFWYLPFLRQSGVGDDGPTAHPHTIQFARKMMHWHAHEPLTLAFVPDGLYMLSGGHEAVLVIWQLQSEQQNYLPRLGAPLTHISVSPDGLVFCLTTADNCLHIVNSVDYKRRVVSGLKNAHTRGFFPHAGLAVDPKRRLLVTNSISSSLQFYDVAADKFAYELAVAHNPNPARLNRKYFPSVDARVEVVAFSPSGDWMATVDRTPNSQFALGMALKFWAWAPRQHRYTLVTVVDEPHRERVHAVVFHPSLPVAVSLGSDGAFKAWEGQSVLKGRVQWGCTSVGEYHGHPPTAAAFSSDGSILAVAHAASITLWEPLSLVLLDVLHHAPPHTHATHLHFTPGAPFLVALSTGGLAVWSLMSASVQWEVQSAPRAALAAVAPLPNTTRFVALAHSPTASAFLLFDIHSPQPLLRLATPTPAHDHFAVLPGAASSFQLAFFRKEGGVCLLSPSDGTQATPADVSGEDARQERNPESGPDAHGLAAIYGADMGVPASGAASASAAAAADTPVVAGRLSMFEDVPSHIIPPPSSLFSTFISAKLARAKTADPAAPESDSADMSTVQDTFEQQQQQQQQPQAKNKGKPASTADLSLATLDTDSHAAMVAFFSDKIRLDDATSTPSAGAPPTTKKKKRQNK